MPPLSDLFESVNAFARSTPWLHAPASAYARYGVVVFALLMLAGWWIARRRSSLTMAAALLAPVATLVAFAVQQVVVSLVSEQRPYAVLPDVLVLIDRTTDPSFPSDHACIVGAVAAALFLVDRRLGWIASVLAVLMAITRVYVGAHWPLDVVAGLALGAAVSAAVVLLLRRPVARLVDRVATTRLAPLVRAAQGATEPLPV
ncbi:MAG TPA: phosphatase PAP2 family protein [Candidatus Nanopelagicales bacterium]|nr:phosphatase PAP2 family protein [Candidatus Nanopelagicales bacterium]